MKEKINSLLDKFCEICHKNNKNSCTYCNLSHRRMRLDTIKAMTMSQDEQTEVI